MIKVMVNGEVYAELRGDVKVEIVDEPGPKYKKKDWFVSREDSKHLIKIISPGFYCGGGYMYKYIIVYDGEKTFTSRCHDAACCIREGLLDEDWLPIPPQPVVPDGEELSWAVKVPEDGDRWCDVCGGINISIAGLLDTRHLDGRRWLIKPKKKTGFVVWEPGIVPDGRNMLRLTTGMFSSVYVTVVDRYGKDIACGDLCKFTDLGIHRMFGAHDELDGIPYDEHGRIKEC